MEEKALEFVTYYELQLEITKRFITIRKNRKISQLRLSEISGVSYASIRRFEKTSDISFASLVKLAIALRLYDDLNNLFKVHKEYQSIEEVINDQEN